MKLKYALLLAALVSQSTWASGGDECVAGGPGPAPNVVATFNTTLESGKAEIAAHYERERKNFVACMDSWRGNKLDDLIYALGAPTRSGRLNSNPRASLSSAGTFRRR